MTSTENDMIDPEDAEAVLRAKINLETSPIPWSDLQVFYARGQVICVAKDLDVVDVAYQLSLDNKALLEQWQEAG